jgi:adenine-specific DNA methylase
MGTDGVKQSEPVSPAAPGSDRRLIEEWLPIAALSEESVRERRSMTALPPTYYLHVWWARRPLVASRAAVLAGLLPADADQKKFLHALGIHGDPVAAKCAMDEARRSGERIANPYDYPRAFAWNPSEDDRHYLRTRGGDGGVPSVLDSTAGGGSIPFEAMRLGCNTYGNDLNPVAWLILKATVEFPARYGAPLLKRYKALSNKWLTTMKSRMQPFFPDDPNPDRQDATFLFARTITCPYCAGLIPLSPNWKLKKDIGVRVVPADVEGAGRVCSFEIVNNTKDQSAGTVKGGSATCPFSGCGRVVDGDEIKEQAQAGKMGEQLFAVVYTERKLVGHTKAGKAKYRKTRGFRAPRLEDNVAERVAAALAEKMPEWQARNLVPDEEVPAGTNDDRPRQYGMPLWRDMFSPRQLLGHGTSVEVFHDLLAKCGGPDNVSDLDKAALTYIAMGIDKMLNWNGILSSWNVKAERMRSVFDRHDFAFKWSFAEMASSVAGIGYDWAISTTGKCLRELIELGGEVTSGDADSLNFGNAPSREPGQIILTNQSGDHLAHLDEASIDCVTIDPPYSQNVMYAELADFFYVWLKRTAGVMFPEEFSAYLTDKDREAVANPAKFKDFKSVRGSGGAGRRANRDYQEKMAGIFKEARRVLKPNGIMTVMFTHKASGAWDALAMGLVEAGFVITASWPIQTEAEGSLHIKDKNAAKSTIFLVCRPRQADVDEGEDTFWEDVEPQVYRVVQEKVTKFKEAGIGGVDLYLACFGPALQVFSEHWPMTRGRPKQKPLPAKGAQLKMLEDEEFDPYAVRPEDALDAARRAVKDWKMRQLATIRRDASLDPVTEWYVLAWDAFQSPKFPADEALKLARVVGLSFDADLRNKVLEVKGGDVILWDSATRAKKQAIGQDFVRVKLDALHHAARVTQQRNVGAARETIEAVDLDSDADFQAALEAVLNVLPTPSMVNGGAKGILGNFAADAGSLEKLRQLMFVEVKQSDRWKAEQLPLFEKELDEAEGGVGG